MRSPIKNLAVTAAALAAGGVAVALGAGGPVNPDPKHEAAARSVGGGSFTRQAAPAAPVVQHGGGGYSGGHAPARPAYVAPNPPPVVSAAPPAPPIQPHPRTSVPAFVAPATRPAPVVTQPRQAAGVSRGGGFIRLPGGAGTGAEARTPQRVVPSAALPSTPKIVSAPRLMTGAAAGVAASPAVQQHIEKRGLSVPAWSATRSAGFERLHLQNAPRLNQFVENRESTWAQIHPGARSSVAMARERGPDWQAYRKNLWAYRYNRADEIRDRIRDSSDGLFTFDWWRLHRGRSFALLGFSPWWWWNPCSWDNLLKFGGYDWNEPIYYDYGANVIDDNGVYVDGQYWGPSANYAQLATQLANPPAAADPPIPPQAEGEPAEWQPFGVFALTQEEKGDAIMFFQLAMNREGLISGAFTNTMVGDTETVSGSIDRKSQLAAWHVGDKTDTVFETGVANLTQEVTPVQIHFGTQAVQTWLLVRMESPDLPASPAPVNGLPPQ